MKTCNGQGKCFTRCFCECFNEKKYKYYEVCLCGHREHNGFCPSNCCNLIECRNYKYCHVKLPEWMLFCHNGMCMNCSLQMGKHTITNKVEECCVCLENTLCNDYIKPLCPICRRLNDFTP